MAGPVWGRATVIIDVDGDDVVRRVRQIGREAGTAGGSEMGDSLNRSLRKSLGKSDAFKGLREKMGGFRKVLQNLSKTWGGLSHNTRQWSLILGALVAGLPTLATLTQAVSGGLIILATNLLAVAAGAGVAIAAFIGLYDESIKLSEGAQASKDAFATLGDTFKALQGDITNAFFDGMASSIAALTSAVQTLSPVITVFAQTAGEQLGRIFEALASDRATTFFTALLDPLTGLAPILESLTTAAIEFGHAIGDIIIASLPFAQQFAGWLAQIATDFANWTAQNPGALEAFFQTAATVLPALGNAVAGLAAQFANLVTPAVVTDVTNLLNNLSTGLQWVFDALSIIGGLDVFGNLLVALTALSALMAPMVDAWTQISTAIGDVLYAALQAVVPIFYSLGAIVGPLVGVFAQLVVSLADALVPVLNTIGELFTALAPVFVAFGEHFAQIAAIAAAFFIPILEQIIGFIGDLLESLLPLIEDALPTLTTLFGLVATAIQFLMPVITFLANIVSGVLKIAFTVIIGVIQAVVAVVRGLADGLNYTLKPALDVMKKALSEFSRFVGDVWRNVERAFKVAINAIVGFFTPLIDAIREVVSWVTQLIGAIGRLDFGAIGNLFGAGGGGGFASGGVLVGPRRILAGEAGPEAIVPLNRALSQVDPSVRWLSAIAQGFSTPVMAGGGVVSGGRAPLALTQNIYQTGDPSRVANIVVNRIAERVAS